MMLKRSWRVSLATAAMVLMCTSCASPRRAMQENERLRFETIEQKQQIESLQQQNQELKAQLATAAGSEGETPLSPELLEATPRVAEISIGRLSFGKDSNGDGVIDRLILYIHPADGRGRFVQLTGEVAMTAMAFDRTGALSKTWQAALAPIQVRDAFRSSLMGTQYTFELPIEASEINEMPADVLVRVTYTDGYSGQQSTAERTISLR